MDFIARVSKEGYDADVASASNLNFYETKPTFKIVKQMFLPANHATGVPHGLDYAPQFVAYYDINGVLYPVGAEIPELGISTFDRASVDDFNIYFVDTDYPKRILLFSDVPNALGYADTSNNENFVFKIKDASTPQKTIMSSEFNHLKEGLNLQGDVTADHLNTTQLTNVETTHYVDIPHNLGYRPHIAITSRWLYDWSERYGENTFLYTEPNIPFAYYQLPSDDYNTYGTMGFMGVPGVVYDFVFLTYEIDEQKIRVKVRCASQFIEGYENWFNEPPDGYYWTLHHRIRTFRFFVKVFLNDVDEIYSYIQ